MYLAKVGRKLCGLIIRRSPLALSNFCRHLPSRVICHSRTSNSGHSYVGPDAHAMIVPWPKITALRPKEDVCLSCSACTSPRTGQYRLTTSAHAARRATRASGYRMRVFRRGVYIPDYTAYSPRTTWLRPSTCASRGTGFRNAAFTLGIAMTTGLDGVHVLLAALLCLHHYPPVYPLWDDLDFAWLSGASASPVGLRGTEKFLLREVAPGSEDS